MWADPAENCHLNVKKLSKSSHFFQKNCQKLSFFPKNCLSGGSDVKGVKGDPIFYMLTRGGNIQIDILIFVHVSILYETLNKIHFDLIFKSYMQT